MSTPKLTAHDVMTYAVAGGLTEAEFWAFLERWGEHKARNAREEMRAALARGLEGLAGGESR